MPDLTRIRLSDYYGGSRLQYAEKRRSIDDSIPYHSASNDARFVSRESTPGDSVRQRSTSYKERNSGNRKPSLSVNVTVFLVHESANKFSQV